MNYYVVRFEHGEESMFMPLPKASMNEFFRQVSYAICYGDCTDYEVTEIVFDDELWHYAGWRPGMEFTYTSDSGDTWTAFFPEWEH